ncbi:hypothetical protein SAMN02910353_00006 [Ruminococcus sp. YRD2003]|uniref:plasmid mobilization protein n=1 Tax=Ruminococcus sp. YRD2003 TaxID=1452313 RepID=UPI0008B77E62|nr:hypothetical protein SAMN02910353_00006 [Ruminococcus flavefaciens]
MNRDSTIQVRLTEEEKQSIIKNAERANIPQASTYLRCIGVEEGKVIFLDKGGYIPRTLIEINDKITGALRSGKISDDLGREIKALLADVMCKFTDVSERLSTIRDEEDDDVCH